MPLGQLHEERPALLEATDAMSWSPYRSPPGREHFDAPGVERRGHLLRSGRRWLAEDPRHERFRGPSCWVDRALVEAVRALGREFKALFWRERGPRRSGPEATDSPVVGGASSPVPTPAVAMTARVPRGRAGARGGCRRRAGSHDGRHRLELVVLARASRHTRALEGPVLLSGGTTKTMMSRKHRSDVIADPDGRAATRRGDFEEGEEETRGSGHRRSVATPTGERTGIVAIPLPFCGVMGEPLQTSAIYCKW